MEAFLRGGLHPDASANPDLYDERTARKTIQERERTLQDAFAAYERTHPFGNVADAEPKNPTFDELCIMVKNADVKTLEITLSGNDYPTPAQVISFAPTIHDLAIQTKNAQVVRLVFAHYHPFMVSTADYWITKAQTAGCDADVLAVIRSSLS